MYYVTGRYKIFGDGLQIYGDIMYSKSKQDNGLAAAPFASEQRLQRADRSACLDLQSVRQQPELGSLPHPSRNLATAVRSTISDYHRYVIGLNGDFNIKDNGFISRFGYDTGFLYEDFDQVRTDSGDAVRTGIVNLVAANIFNPFIGVRALPSRERAPTYINGVPTGLTAPYDNSQAAQLFTAGGAQYIGHSIFKEHDYLFDIKTNAHLFPNWWNGGFDLAAGYEKRQIRQQSIPDPVQAGGDQLGFNQAPNTKTTQEVDFVLLRVGLPVRDLDDEHSVRPLASMSPSRGVMRSSTDSEQLTKLRASFDNVNDDEDFGGTPRIAIRYQPIADLTLRAGFNQSFLSPTPSSLFDPVGQNFPQLFDPVNQVTLQPPEGVWQGGNRLCCRKRPTPTLRAWFTLRSCSWLHDDGRLVSALYHGPDPESGRLRAGPPVQRCHRSGRLRQCQRFRPGCSGRPG